MPARLERPRCRQSGRACRPRRQPRRARQSSVARGATRDRAVSRRNGCWCCAARRRLRNARTKPVKPSSKRSRCTCRAKRKASGHRSAGGGRPRLVPARRSRCGSRGGRRRSRRSEPSDARRTSLRRLSRSTVIGRECRAASRTRSAPRCPRTAGLTELVVQPAGIAARRRTQPSLCERRSELRLGGHRRR